jgi:16S rRNA (cytidine1402-2'-O)-methyltransferase
MSVAGFEDARFAFEGFLPRRRSRRRDRLSELADRKELLAFFEAPHRLVECLKDMLDVLGDRECLVARELTKLHETIERGSLSTLLGRFSGGRPRGELVVICEGARQAEPASPPAEMKAEAESMARQGMRKTEIAKRLARRYGARSKDIYRMLTRENEQRRKGEYR